MTNKCNVCVHVVSVQVHGYDLWVLFKQRQSPCDIRTESGKSHQTWALAKSYKSKKQPAIELYKKQM